MPVLILHGARDREIPIHHARALFLKGRMCHDEDGNVGPRVLMGLRLEEGVNLREGKSWVSERREKGRRGPPKVKFVELFFAHHNNVQYQG